MNIFVSIIFVKCLLLGYLAEKTGIRIAPM